MAYRTMVSILISLFAWTGSAAAAAPGPLNAKSGIDIAFPGGIQDKDYVVEQLYHDGRYDDRGVVYIKQNTPIALAHNADNIDPKGFVIGASGKGEIRYKIDGDELWEGESGRGNAQPYAGKSNDYKAHPAVRKYAGAFSLESLGIVGKVGDNGKAETAWGHYHRGVVDSFGDEWHTLTYWDDDSAWFTGTVDGWDLYLNGSDSKIVQFVVNPKTPAISFSASGSDQYYTTPAKTYYIPKIHKQKTYITRGTIVKLVNLTNRAPVYFSFDGRLYRRYPDKPQALSKLMRRAGIRPQRNKLFTLYYRNGRNGIVKRRQLYLEPPSPTKGKESHPKFFWRRAGEHLALKKKLARFPYRDAYAALKTSTKYTKADLDFRDGTRFWGKSGAGGFRSHREVGQAALNNGLTAAIEGYAFDNYSYANRAKQALLAAFTIDPVGDENVPAAAYGSPAQDRVYYGFERRTHIAFPAGYDLMADYTTANGYRGGFTPIEEYKVRDNLASEALQLLHRRDSERSRGNWMVGTDLSLPAFAMAMPTYSTPYYGTSGADIPAAGYASGPTPATHYDAPFPDQKVTWWEATGPKMPTGSYPNLTNKWSLLTYFGQKDGYWKEGHLGQYNLHLFPFISALMNFRANYDGGRYPYLEEHAAGAVYNRHPRNGQSLAAANGDSARNQAMLTLINRRFPKAGLYRWHLDTPAVAVIDYRTALLSESNLAYNLAFFDYAIKPKAPSPGGRITPNTATFTSDPKNPRAVFGRLQGQDFNDIYIRWVGQATDFMIDAYGENLLIRPGKGLAGLPVSPEGYNTILVDDTGSTLQAGVTLRSKAPLKGLTAPGLDFAGAKLDDRRGGGPYDAKKITLRRTVVFAARRFFVLFDELDSKTGPHRYGLTLHGSTDGRQDALKIDAGQGAAVWRKAGGVKLLARIIAPKVNISRHAGPSSITGKTEPYIIATAKGENVRFITALVPLRPGQAPPRIQPLKEGRSVGGRIKNGRKTFWFDFGSGQGLRRAPGGYTTDAKIAFLARDRAGLKNFMIKDGRRFSFGGRTYLNTSVPVDAVFAATRNGPVLKIKRRERP